MTDRSCLRRALLGLGLLLAALLPGCGGGGGGSSPAEATAPAIMAQPANQTVAVNATATFTVTASGTAPLSYLWSKNGASITGATAASYQTPPEVMADNGAWFTVTVSNSAGQATSGKAYLTVEAATSAPSFTTQPTNQTVLAGQTATFTAAASGSPAPTCQWQRSSDGASWANVTTGTGGATFSYTTAATALADSGAWFRAVATNSVSSADSDIVQLTVNAAPAAPSFLSQPSGALVGLGQTATFTVAVSGTPTPTCQWQRLNSGGSTWANVTTGTGGTTLSYTTAATTTADSGAQFRAVATNSAGSVNSSPATLTVDTLSASVTPQQFVSVTKPATITATASGGTAPYTYAWSKDGTPLTGTASSYAIVSLRLADQGVYTVTVKDAAGITATAASNLFVATTAALPTGLNPVGVAVSGDNIYLTSPTLGQVLQLNRYSANAVTVSVGGGPTGITVDASDNPWVALNTTGQIAKIAATTGAVTYYSVGGQPYGMAADGNGNIWFTLQGTNQVGRIPAAGGTPTYFTLSSGATPAGLNVDAGGNLWFTERGLAQVGRIASGASQAEEWKCPETTARPEQILATAGGQVFYTDQNSSAVVMFTVATQAASAGSTTVTDARPRLVSHGALVLPFAYGLDPLAGPAGVAVDGSGYVWMTQQGNGKVTRLQPADGSTYTYWLPSSQSQPTGITVGSDGSVWAALAGVDQLAQIPSAPLDLTVSINATEPRRVLEGETQTYTVTVTGATDPTVTWELLEGAAAGAITEGGVYTATTTPGIYHVLARSVQDPSKFGRLEVMVYPFTQWPAGQLALWAGNVDGVGNVDGLGSQARFNGPSGIARDGSGNLYVADSLNDTIRLIKPAGQVSTFAGSPSNYGWADGTASAARFYRPEGLAFDPSGNLIVVDTNSSIIRRITPDGWVSTLAGNPLLMGSSDGTGAAATFWLPTAVAVDANGTIYVADTGNDTIRKITSAGVVTTFAGTAKQTGATNGTSALFNEPSGLAVDGAGNVYVADTRNQLIRMITPAGVVSTLAGQAGTAGGQDGTGTGATFEFPQTLVSDSLGNLTVMAGTSVRHITPGGVVTTAAIASNGTVAAGSEGGAVLDGSGDIYRVDPSSVANVVYEITAAGTISLVAGQPGLDGSADGTGSAAGFFMPAGLAGGPGNVVYVADWGNSTIRMINDAAYVTTIAGKAGYTGVTDASGSAARFNLPQGIAVSASGSIFVADTRNYTLREINPSGYGVTTWAGQVGNSATITGTGLAAAFQWPGSLAFDGLGNLYVDENATIRKATAAAYVTTLAGTPGVFGSADGTGAAASFIDPAGVAGDASGNVYVADTGNNTIRKITPQGVVTTFAGSAGWTLAAGTTFGFVDGTGAAARFNGPQGLALDGSGNLWVADTFNNAIRMITPAGFVATIVGDRTCGLNRPGALRDDGGAPLASTYGGLAQPQQLAFGTDGSLYITTNNGVMKVTFTAP